MVNKYSSLHLYSIFYVDNKLLFSLIFIKTISSSSTNYIFSYTKFSFISYIIVAKEIGKYQHKEVVLMGDRRGFFGGLFDNGSELLFFFLLLVIIFCNCYGYDYGYKCD